MIKMSTDDIKKLLVDPGVKASLPRVKIYEFLNTNRIHPTVDEIYNSLSEELVTLSKTTVYNTLNLFIKNHIVTQVLIEDNEVRYDADMTNHGHFKCKICDKVYDFEYNLSDHKIKGLDGFQTDEYHTYVKGVCKSCNKSRH